ncbi:kinase, partial [Thraustotheca clavata]
KGETPLYIAADKGHIAVISQLLDANANSKIAANNQLTPLMVATKNNNTEAARLLVLETRVFDIVQTGDVIKLKSLLSKLLNSKFTDSDGNSLLHLAVKYNQSLVFYELVNLKGIQLDCCNNYNETPLTLSMKLCNDEFAKFIHNALKKPSQYIGEEELKIEYEHPLGEGSFGSVYEGRYNEEIVAIKILKNSTLSIDCEIANMQRCVSPYVLQLVGHSALNTKAPKIVLPYMDGGDLRSYLDKKLKEEATMTNFSTFEIAWAIASGLADIHRCSCIHRDLKSPNVLLSTKHYIKIADLGLTRQVKTIMTDVRGSLAWTAPEMLSHQPYSYPADIYSFGIILTELDTFACPYLGVPLGDLINGVLNGSLRPSLKSTCPSWYKRLVESCLEKDPCQRPTALDIITILQDQLDSSEAKD